MIFFTFRNMYYEISVPNVGIHVQILQHIDCISYFLYRCVGCALEGCAVQNIPLKETFNPNPKAKKIFNPD